jgi:hypothetical protein
LKSTWVDFHQAREKRRELKAADTAAGGELSGVFVIAGSSCDSLEDWRVVSETPA